MSKKKTPFQKARGVMGRKLKTDEDLREGYRSNIAMLLHDRYGITSHRRRNQAAEDILNLIFEL